MLSTSIPLLFSGNRYTFKMPLSDAQQFQNEIQAQVDEQINATLPLGSDRYILTEEGLGGFGNDTPVIIDFRNEQKSKDYALVTLETDQNVEQKPTDAFIFAKLYEQIKGNQESFLKETLAVLTENFSTEKEEVQYFSYNIDSLFPEVDYENILTPEEIKDPNKIPEGSKQTPLIKAIDQKDRTKIDALLAHPEIDVNTRRDKGSTPPIGWAAHHGDLETLKKLLLFDELKINLASANSQRTALQYAIDQDHKDIIECLKNNNATTEPELD